jgi:hypothetical protein
LYLETTGFETPYNASPEVVLADSIFGGAFGKLFFAPRIGKYTEEIFLFGKNGRDAGTGA